MSCGWDTFLSGAINQNSLTFTAPLDVSNLDVWEIDEKKKIIKLRWKPPPETQGELEEYIMENKNNVVKNNGTSCVLWPHFICGSIGSRANVENQKITVSNVFDKTILKREFDELSV